MIQALLLVLITFVILFVWLKWIRVKNYWAERHVPHTPPNFVFGSLTFLMRENPGTWFRRINEQFKSAYIGVWLFWKPCLLVNSPDIAKNILVRDFGNFRDRYLRSGSTDPLGALNIFTVDDPVWSPIRRRLTTVFTASKLRCIEDYIRMKSKQIIQRIASEGYKIKDLKEMYTDFTTDIVGTSSFGVESTAILDGKGPLREVTKEFSKFSVFRSMSWCSIFFIPQLVNYFRFKFYPKSSEAYFREIFHSVATQRASATDNRTYQDLLDLLLKIKDDSKIDGEGYSDEFIVAQAAIFLLGGYETTGTTLCYCTYELAHEPDIQEKLYEELLEAKKKNGTDVFEGQTLYELPFLDSVLKETLRKYPIMGWLDRIAASDYKIDDSLTIEAGTVVYVNAMGMHYDPELFPEPKKFKPERFLPENEKNIHPYSCLPFGDGPRFCIGKRFALMMIKFAMASVILNYKIKTIPNTPKPDDIKMQTLGLFYLPGEAISVEFIPRT